MLLANPASRLHAAVAGWEHPLDYVGIYQLDLIDLLLMRWSEKGKFKPIPRPWDKKRPSKGRTATEALRILRPHLAEKEPDQGEGDDSADDGSGDGESEPGPAELFGPSDSVETRKQRDDPA